MLFALLSALVERFSVRHSNWLFSVLHPFNDFIMPNLLDVSKSCGHQKSERLTIWDSIRCQDVIGFRPTQTSWGPGTGSPGSPQSACPWTGWVFRTPRPPSPPRRSSCRRSKERAQWTLNINSKKRYMITKKIKPKEILITFVYMHAICDICNIWASPFHSPCRSTLLRTWPWACPPPQLPAAPRHSAKGTGWSTLNWNGRGCI